MVNCILFSPLSQYARLRAYRRAIREAELRRRLLAPRRRAPKGRRDTPCRQMIYILFARTPPRLRRSSPRHAQISRLRRYHTMKRTVTPEVRPARRPARIITYFQLFRRKSIVLSLLHVGWSLLLYAHHNTPSGQHSRLMRAIDGQI